MTTPADEYRPAPRNNGYKPDQNYSERWARIPGFARQYCVSSYGRVVRLANSRSHDVRLHRQLLLVPTFSGSYLRVSLRSAGSRQLYRVDRLMLCSFAHQPLAVFDVAYKNGDRLDLRLENLARLNTITVLGPPGKRRRIIRTPATAAPDSRAAGVHWLTSRPDPRPDSGEGRPTLSDS